MFSEKMHSNGHAFGHFIRRQKLQNLKVTEKLKEKKERVIKRRMHE